MRLRTIGLVSILALGLVVGSSAAEAQSPRKTLRIGYLGFRAAPTATDEAFVQGLRDLGWNDGENITIEYRWAAGKRSQYPILAKELVRLKVDLIVATIGSTTRAAKNATTTIPIVMASGSNAVESWTCCQPGAARWKCDGSD